MNRVGLCFVMCLASWTPACGTQGDDGSGGRSSGGSAAKAGSGGAAQGGSSGTAARGGTSGTGAGGAAGGSGGTGTDGGTGTGAGGAAGGGDQAPSCDVAGQTVPAIDCPIGAVNMLDDAVCKAALTCIAAADCAENGVACSSCLAAEADQEFAAEIVCVDGATADDLTYICGEYSALAALTAPDCPQ